MLLDHKLIKSIEVVIDQQPNFIKLVARGASEAEKYVSHFSATLRALSSFEEGDFVPSPEVYNISIDRKNDDITIFGDVKYVLQILLCHELITDQQHAKLLEVFPQAKNFEFDDFVEESAEFKI